MTTIGWTTVSRIDSDSLNGACLVKRCSCGHSVTVRANGNDPVGSAMRKDHNDECLHQRLVSWCYGDEDKLAALGELVDRIPTWDLGYEEDGDEIVSIPWISRQGTTIAMASMEDVDDVYDDEGSPLTRETFERIREIIVDDKFIRVEHIYAEKLEDLLTESEQESFSHDELNRRVETVGPYERRIVNLSEKAIKCLEKIHRLHVHPMERGGCLVSSR